MWLKMGLSGYFFVLERHISIQMLGCLSVAPLKSLCHQLLPEFSSNYFETLHINYKHFEDVHVNFCRQNINF